MIERSLSLTRSFFVLKLSSVILNILNYVSRTYLVSYVITNKKLILLYFDNGIPQIFRDRHIFPQKTHVVEKIEIPTAIVSQTLKFLI